MEEKMEVDPESTIPEKDNKKHQSQQAEDLKNQGNEEYKKSNYAAALDFYSQAIDLSPETAAFYGNRSACYFMCGNHQLALQDARHALRINPDFTKARLREGRCLLTLGDPASAADSFQQVLSQHPGNTQALQELNLTQRLMQLEQEYTTAWGKPDHRLALYKADQCIHLVPACTKYQVERGECLVALGRTTEAQSLVINVLRADPSHVDALYVRGLALYYDEQHDKAKEHFTTVLKLAPEHCRARTAYKRMKSLIASKDAGRSAFVALDWAKAKKLYTEAMNVDPANKMAMSKLHYNRALAASHLGEHDEVIKDCCVAVELDPSYVKAFVRRAKSYTAAECFEEALRDYENVLKMDPTREHKSMVAEAKRELKKSKRKDYYKILGVSKDASDDDIKKAYKKRAMVHHPDRHAHDSEDVQRDEERKFKEVGEAYSILSDGKKKARYDMGHDLEDLDGGGADFDPTVIFQSFFGGGGGGGFGGSGFTQGAAGGMPGFSFKFA